MNKYGQPESAEEAAETEHGQEIEAAERDNEAMSIAQEEARQEEALNEAIEAELKRTGTAVISVNPALDPAFAHYKEQAETILVFAKARTVGSDDEVRAAVNDLGIISVLKKGIDETRQKFVKPLNDYVKDINTAFKEISGPVDEADRITREKINTYRAEVERKRIEAEKINREKEELARREAALNEGVITVNTTPVVVPEAAPKRVQADTGSLGTTKVWKFEVVDFAALEDQYKLADMVKIGKVVRAGVQIKGVRVWQEESLRVTAAR